VAFFNPFKTAWAKDFRRHYPETSYSKGFHQSLFHHLQILKKQIWGKILVNCGFQQLSIKKKNQKKNFVAIKNRIYLSHIKIQKKLS